MTNIEVLTLYYPCLGDNHSLDAADGDPVDAVYVDEEGNTNSTSLRDMRKYKNTYVSADDDVKFVNDNMDALVGDMQKQINDFAKNGTKSRSQILNGMTKNGDLYIDDLKI